jgi:hypothetical protein
MNLLALYIYIILGILIASLELRRRFNGKALDAMTVFNCYYFVLFVFVPVNVMSFGEDVIRQKYAYATYGSGDTSTALSILFCYALFYLGYSLKSPKRQFAIAGGRNYFSLADSAHIARIIFFIGALLMAVYAIQIGGITAAVSTAAEVRSGEIRLEGKYVFYRYFCQFSADAFVLFFAVVIGKSLRKIKITSRDKVFLLCALLFFVYYALSTGGRRPFIYPVILCYLVYSSVKGLSAKATVAVLLVVCILAGLGTMFVFLSSTDNWSVLAMAPNADTGWRVLAEVIYDNATQGLGDSYIHFVGAQKASLWQFGFLTDIVNLPRDFFPSRLFGFERGLHMYGETTEFFLGYPIVDNVGGGEPLGLHGYLLVNFGYAGMFASFFLLGLFYKWIHSRCKPADPKDAVGWLVYWWVVLAFFIYFREGALIFVLKEPWWVTIVLLVYFRAKRRASLKSSYASDGFGSISTNQVKQT